MTRTPPQLSLPPGDRYPLSVSYESTTPEPVTPPTPREDVGRGALVALAILPVGVIVWLLIWSAGYIASIVAFGVAVGALWLYRLGARGPISKAGAFVVAGITVVTLLIAFFAGIVLDGVRGFADATGLSWVEIITAPTFWELFWQVLPEAFGDYTVDLLLALGFGALGCFAVLRTAFAQAKAGAEPAAAEAAEVAAAEGADPAAPAGFAAPAQPAPAQPAIVDPAVAAPEPSADAGEQPGAPVTPPTA